MSIRKYKTYAQSAGLFLNREGAKGRSLPSAAGMQNFKPQRRRARRVLLCNIKFLCASAVNIYYALRARKNFAPSRLRGEKNFEVNEA
jgi:hypothetical protein